MVPPTDQGLFKAVERGKFPNRGLFMPHVPGRLRTVVRNALRVDPAERFQSATEMADAIGRVRLALDWLTEPLPSGGFRWTARRDGYADIIVELSGHAGGTWNVRTYTEKPGEPRRAKGKSENWRTGVSLDAAHVHLKEVFQRATG